MTVVSDGTLGKYALLFHDLAGGNLPLEMYSTPPQLPSDPSFAKELKQLDRQQVYVFANVDVGHTNTK